MTCTSADVVEQSCCVRFLTGCFTLNLTLANGTAVAAVTHRTPNPLP